VDYENFDNTSKNTIENEAQRSKNRVRVRLLEHIHAKLEQQDTPLYDPACELSHSGEFEAMGA
jgi:hypothetical protein